MKTIWRCFCGDPTIPGVLHRREKPCYPVYPTEEEEE